MNIKNNKGVTLLEIMIAITMMTLVMSAGSGIYLSGVNLIDTTVKSTQAYRNAQIVLMHMEKNIRNAASRFTIVNNAPTTGDVTLTYRIYQGATDIYSGPSITRGYSYVNNLDQIIYDPNTEVAADEIIVSNHISYCNFSITEIDGVVLNISATALDNNDNPNSAYTLNTHIEATATAFPSVFYI